jgi:hypothetical protein
MVVVTNPFHASPAKLDIEAAPVAYLAQGLGANVEASEAFAARHKETGIVAMKPTEAGAIRAVKVALAERDKAVAAQAYREAKEATARAAKEAAAEVEQAKRIEAEEFRRVAPLAEDLPFLAGLGAFDAPTPLPRKSQLSQTFAAHVAAEAEHGDSQKPPHR